MIKGLTYLSFSCFRDSLDRKQLPSVILYARKEHECDECAFFLYDRKNIFFAQRELARTRGQLYDSSTRVEATRDDLRSECILLP